MPAMRWHALRDVLERGHDAQLRQPSQPGIVHYSAADAATSAGLLPSLMRIERPIDLLICYSDWTMQLDRYRCCRPPSGVISGVS
jgi:hypothetical protein